MAQFESEIWISSSPIPPKGGPPNDTNDAYVVTEMVWGKGTHRKFMVRISMETGMEKPSSCYDGYMM